MTTYSDNFPLYGDDIRSHAWHGIPNQASRFIEYDSHHFNENGINLGIIQKNGKKIYREHSIQSLFMM